MKKLILILALLISLNGFGQTVLTSGSTVLRSGTTVLYTWQAESSAIFAAMGTTPPYARKVLIDNLVKGLKDDGVWTLLDFFYILAAHAENSSLLNWINPGTFDATNVSSTAFEVDRGYTGDGAADYLNSNYNPNTDGINLSLNSASFGCYIRTNVAEDKYDIGVLDGGDSYIISRWSNDIVYTRINDNNSLNIANIDSRGFWISNRTGANIRNLYKNSISVISEVRGSTGVPNDDMYILAGNVGGAVLFSTKQIAAAFAGGGMTQTNVDNMTDRLETFMDAIGAGVISEMMWLILLLIPNIRRKEEEFKIAA